MRKKVVAMITNNSNEGIWFKLIRRKKYPPHFYFMLEVKGHRGLNED